MYRLVLFWLPSLLRQLRNVAAFTIPLIVLLAYADVPPGVLVGVLLACLAFWFSRYGLQLARFGRATWRFRTVAAGPIVLRYAPELHDRIDLEHCLKRSRETLTDLAQTFGFPLRRRLVIFLFPTAIELSRVFRHPCGACALIRGDAIAVSSERLLGGNLDEVMMHEMAHLFSERLGPFDPPFKSEGLATWLMGNIDGKPIDFYALATILTDPYRFLLRLVTPIGFSAEEACYVLAGSFTGDLIRRFGWERYGDFFRRATGKNFESCFTQVFGLSLLQAEHQWREALLQRRQSFEPALSRSVAERRVEAAYQSGQVYRCLHEIDALAGAGQASGKVLFYAAQTHFYLGHYEQAVQALEQALRSDDLWIEAQRGDCWQLLGNLHDLLGERNKAVEAYQSVLTEQDTWAAYGKSLHALARRYLKRAFTEQDLAAVLRPSSKELRGRRQQQ